MKVATAYVEVRPDVTNFGRDLDKQVTDKAKGASLKLSQVLGAGAFLAGANKAIDAASQLEQAVGGTAAVFGDASAGVEEFARNAAEGAGLSERAARELTSALGGLLKGFGFTTDEAAKLSTELATLGADLAATFGGTPEEAVQALGAALRGETDPLERFGIALNQTLVNQKAVELGLAATTSSVDQQAKAQATLELITLRSADAQGQFAREADTAAGQAAIAAAETENAAADLGDNLLPIYTRLAETVGTVAGVFGALPEPVQTAAIALGAIVAVGPAVISGVGALKDVVGGARAGLSKAFDAASVGAYNFAGNLGKVAVGAGALGGALYAASVLLRQYQDSKADAARIEQAYTDILAEQTEEVGKNTKAFAGAEILKGALGEALREAGADVDVFTDAIVDGTAALEGIDLVDLRTGLLDVDDALNDIDPGPLRDELIELADAGALTDDQMRELLERLIRQQRGYADGAREAENKAAADEAAGVAADTATPKVAGLTDAIAEEDQAAKDAAESLDLFREAVERLLEPLNLQEAQDERTRALNDLQTEAEERAQAVEDARRRLADIGSSQSDRAVSNARAIADAERNLAEARARVANTDAKRLARTQAIEDAERSLARAMEDAADDGSADREVAEAQQALQDAIDATSLSLDGESEAALRNRETMRELVENGVRVIETAREQGATLDELELIRINEKALIEESAAALGIAAEGVSEYTDLIDEVPINKATTLTVDTAAAQLRVKELLDSLNALAPSATYSIDAAVIDRNLQRAATQERALGGNVADGLFTVGEYGASELLRKQGSRVDVIAGAQPTPVVTNDLAGDQLLEARENNRLLRLIATRLETQPPDQRGGSLRYMS